MSADPKRTALGACFHRLEWRCAVDGLIHVEHRPSAEDADRDALLIATSKGCEGGEVRIVPEDARGRSMNRGRFVTMDSSDRRPVRGFAGSRRRSDIVRRRDLAMATTRGVRRILLPAVRESLLKREQMVEMLEILELAYRGLGPASRHVG